MIRASAIEIGLLLAPFVLYGLYLATTRAGMPAGRSYAKAWKPRRFAGGLIVLFVWPARSFVAPAQFSGAPPNANDVPARMEDGKLVPGATR